MRVVLSLILTYRFLMGSEEEISAVALIEHCGGIKNEYLE